MKIKIGSRGSHLALAQSRYVRKRLAESAGVEAEIIIIKTSGDRIQNVPLSSIGDSPDERKGFFTKELEDALLSGDIDLAVHSFKDLPTLDPPGLSVCSIPERVTPGDVLLIPKEKVLGSEPPFLAPGSGIGTSSVRRSAQLEMLWPTMRSKNIRGNVPTRIEKLKLGLSEKPESDVPGEPIDAIMLAGAGLERLRATGLFSEGGEHAGLLDGLEIRPLDPDVFIPAPAQGALALQCRATDEAVRSACEKLHIGDAADLVGVERTVLASLEGGCHLPLGAHCHGNGDGVVLDVFLGREAVDNRRGESFRARRLASSPEKLAERFKREIKEGLPIVLTGREDRIREIMGSGVDANLHALPLIQVQDVEPDESTLPSFQEWMRHGLGEPAQGIPNLVAAFSVPGTRALAKYIAREYPDLDLNKVVWDFCVTGERTAKAVNEYFPASRIAMRSPDGTGESLARLLLKFPPVNYDPCAAHVLATAAEYGRTEFRDVLTGACVQVTNLSLYRTESMTPTPEAVKALPRGACLLFGSPSAVKAYASYLKSQSDDADGDFCHGALGPTTARAMREAGIEIYAQADEPDYEAFIRELS